MRHLRISPEGEHAEIVVAGVNLVGLALIANNDMAMSPSTQFSVYPCKLQEHFYQ